MEDKLQNSISTKQLLKEYNWYQNTFPQVIETACNEFFENNFKTEFIGLSKNINCLISTESCFVTKIKIDKDYDIFFRLTDKAINLILTKSLGQLKSRFNINKISELEAKIITSFNDYMFESIKSCLSQPDGTQLKRTNFDVVHLTFLIRDTDETTHLAGKMIIAVPLDLVQPQSITPNSSAFSEDDFPDSETFASVFVGKTKFSLYDLKNLETDDVVVFENSNLENMNLTINGETLNFQIRPNMDLLIEDENNGGADMGNTNQNIWDSIEVEMSAEFDTVKISLGELKNIENGLVVDLTSLYDNNVTLKVEGKPIASGALVIVNDRYGVKINNVIASGRTGNYTEPQADEQMMSEDETENSEVPTEDENYEQPQGEEAPQCEEDFDYSDFELEDENI